MHPMPRVEKIDSTFADSTINLAVDTINKNKQALVFVNSRRSAEKQAEEIAKKSSANNIILAEKVAGILPKPTKQCLRLSNCIKKGVAFHHAGLHARQKELIEDEFRKGTISIICSTPTLAAGLDLPAFRTIIKDLKRYGGRFGMVHIPVLEFLQMAGRAGRPKFDSFGESICIAKTDSEAHEIFNNFIRGEPEEIYSKLAVEPVLRTYLLSLISSSFVSSDEEIETFFKKTFWAFQFKDMNQLTFKIQQMLQLLIDYKFITKGGGDSDFVSADEISSNHYKPTLLGKRVSELYLDPLTANQIVNALTKAKDIVTNEFSYLHLICNTLEIRPRLRVRTKEWDLMQEKSIFYQPYFLENEPSIYEPEFEDFMRAIKTALMFHHWIDEFDDEYIYENFNCAPGETRAKLNIADWLLFCCIELNKILGFTKLNKDLNRIRTRLKYGVKEELLPLIKFEGIGRSRARKLFHSKIRDIGDVKRTDLVSLSQIVGKQIALNLKKQVGEAVKEIAPKARKGQLSIHKFGK